MEMGGDMDTTMMQTVAAQVARRWRRKGVVSYPVEDMEQDAMAAMLEAHDRFNPEHGVPLRAYLWRVAVNATNLSVAKALCPLSASRASYLKSIKLERVSEKEYNPQVDHGYEDHDANTRVKTQLKRLTKSEEDMYGVSVLLGDAPAAVAEKYGVPVKLVYVATLRMTKRCRKDIRLKKLSKEVL